MHKQSTVWQKYLKPKINPYLLKLNTSVALQSPSNSQTHYFILNFLLAICALGIGISVTLYTRTLKQHNQRRKDKNKRGRSKRGETSVKEIQLEEKETVPSQIIIEVSDSHKDGK